MLSNLISTEMIVKPPYLNIMLLINCANFKDLEACRNFKQISKQKIDRKQMLSNFTFTRISVKAHFPRYFLIVLFKNSANQLSLKISASVTLEFCYPFFNNSFRFSSILLLKAHNLTIKHINSINLLTP